MHRVQAAWRALPGPSWGLTSRVAGAMDALTILQAFQRIYPDSHRPEVCRAPGRINLIGEHTDYNDGFVLPMAIDRAIWIALRPRDDLRVVVHSADYQEARDFTLDSLVDEEGHLQNQGSGWIEYLKGTAWSLADAGFKLRGWEGVLQGDVPLGAGLSSSAALEMVTW